MVYDVAPLRVRGLKHAGISRPFGRMRVAPLRVRGLKQTHSKKEANEKYVAPLRVRGLKPRVRLLKSRSVSRTFAGAWIETDCI